MTIFGLSEEISKAMINFTFQDRGEDGVYIDAELLVGHNSMGYPCSVGVNRVFPDWKAAKAAIEESYEWGRRGF